uniref:NADH:ubiquinone reductase (H(+)-translocating) n=1 Tax=Amegilla calceifera TaxID=597987 RepID=A0A7U0M7U0_9HYME|nr:NADH dehydrogenase subunit 5 [Amegilla calceifera]QQX28006.1 NADH dehydrogenase subunit 5 [Amegilla calceifera]
MNKMLMMSTLIMLTSMFFLLMSMYMMMLNSFIIIEWSIMNFNSNNMNMIIIMDNKSTIFMATVSLITAMMILYSTEYMKMDNFSMNKFTLLTLMFYCSMMILISSPNMLSVIIGWDGLGLISYCLIIFYNSKKAFNAGMLTIMINRIGDIALIMIICYMVNLGSWNLNIYKMNMYLLVLMVIMAFTKSAQLPFSSWLPAAMMAPTPVSALVHSSTLVTAGIYIMIKYSKLIYNMNISSPLLMISSMTMMFAGIMAITEMDMKKIVALSTLSQLGFMMSIMLMGYEKLAFLHLIIHAMFKSLMFFAVGSLIHQLNNSQDIRDFKGISSMFPLKSLILTFSILALCGFPFLCGFYSKDLILEFMFNNQFNSLIMMNLILGTILTTVYSMRMITSIYSLESMKFNLMNFHLSISMNMVMMIMMTLSIVMSLLYLKLNYLELKTIIPLNYKIMPIKMMLVGIIIQLSLTKIKYMKINMYMYMATNMMLMNNFYSNSYNLPMKMVSKYNNKIEKMIMDSLLNKFVMILYFYTKKLNLLFMSPNNMLTSMIIFMVILIMII